LQGGVGVSREEFACGYPSIADAIVSAFFYQGRRSQGACAIPRKRERQKMQSARRRRRYVALALHHDLVERAEIGKALNLR
jgi:hypothetical protein